MLQIGYLFSWGMDIASQRKVQYIRFAFMIAGHTKFSPDRLFSQVVNSYNRKDLFTISELEELCLLHATTRIEDGTLVLKWRDVLGVKYSDLPGTRKLHDFLIALSQIDHSTIVRKVRGKCSSGNFTSSPLKLWTQVWLVLRTPTSYLDDPLLTEKMGHMVTNYNQFVLPERRPTYLPPYACPFPGHPSQLSFVPGTQPIQPSCALAPQPDASRSRKRKPSSCSTPGCTGKG